MTKSKAETWWEDHPFFRRFYVPLVVTTTCLVTLIDFLNGARCR